MWLKIEHNWGLVAITLAGILAMSAATQVDLGWTEALGRASYPWFEEAMGRSIFEGEGFGANDPVIILLLGTVAIYYMGWRQAATKKWAMWRPMAGYILVSALVSAVYCVHGLKWIMGRARPDLVLHKGLPFSHWFTFGPHFVTDGVFHGAFPSGHTSQMFILMTLAYVLAGDPLVTKPIRRLGLAWAMVALAASLTMGLTRCMTLSHWLTDIVGSICIGWPIMHVLYYHILRVPQQRRFMAAHDTWPSVPNAWEIVFCIHLFVGVLGIMMIIIGTRAMIIHHGEWLGWLIPVGGACIWCAWKWSAALILKIWRAYDSKKTMVS